MLYQPTPPPAYSAGIGVTHSEVVTGHIRTFRLSSNRDSCRYATPISATSNGTIGPRTDRLPNPFDALSSVSTARVNPAAGMISTPAAFARETPATTATSSIEPAIASRADTPRLRFGFCIGLLLSRSGRSRGGFDSQRPEARA